MEKRLSLTIDPSKAKEGAKQLEQALGALSKKASEINKAFDRLGNVDQLSNQVGKLEAKVKALGGQTGKAVSPIDAYEKAIQKNYHAVSMLNTELGKELELSKKMVVNKRLVHQATSEQAKAVEAETIKTKQLIKVEQDLIKTKERLALTNTKQYKELQKYKKELNAAEKAARGLDTQSRNLQRSMMGVGIAASMFSGTMIAQDMLQTLDTYTELQNRLAVVTGQTEGLALATRKLLDVSVAARSDLEATTDLYAKLNRVAGKYGLSQERVLRLTETVSKAVSMSGASSSAAQGAIIQFGQALANNFSAAGQELNSINEQTPALAQALAQAITATGKLGVVAQSDLKRLAKEGKITTDIIVEGLEMISSTVDQKFNAATKTMGQAWTSLTDSVVVAAGELDNVTGISDSVVKSLEMLTEQINGDKGLVAGIAGFATTIGSAAFLGSLAALGFLVGAPIALGVTAVTGLAAAASYLTVKFFEAEIEVQSFVDALEKIETVQKRLNSLTPDTFNILNMDQVMRDNAKALDITAKGIKKVRDNLSSTDDKRLVELLTFENQSIDQNLKSIDFALIKVQEKLAQDPKDGLMKQLKTLLENRKELLTVEQKLNSLFGQGGFAEIKLDEKPNQDLIEYTGKVDELLLKLRSSRQKAKDDLDQTLDLLKTAAAMGVDELKITQARERAYARYNEAIGNSTKSVIKLGESWKSYEQTLQEQIKTFGMSAEQLAVYNARQEAAAKVQSDYTDLLEAGKVTQEEVNKKQEEAADKAEKLTKAHLDLQEAQRLNLQSLDLFVETLSEGGITAQELTLAEQELQKQVDAGTISIDRATEAMARLNAEKERMDKLVSDTTFEAMGNSIESFFKDIDKKIKDYKEAGGGDPLVESNLYRQAFKGVNEGIIDGLQDNGLRGVIENFSGDFSSLVSDGIGKSLTGSFSKLGASSGMAGFLGGLGGAAFGAIVGGILQGSKTVQTGSGYRVGVESGNITSAMTSESFKRTNFLGSKRWTDYTEMTVNELDQFTFGLTQATSQTQRQAKLLGISLGGYTGVIKNKNGDLSEAFDQVSNDFADQAFAAIEKYQNLGESVAETFSRLANQAKAMQEGFELTGLDFSIEQTDFFKMKLKENLDSYSKSITEYQGKIAELEAKRISAVSGGDAEDRARQNAEARRYNKELDKEIQAAQDNINELQERILGVHTETIQSYRDEILDVISQVEGVSREQAGGVFSSIAQSFYDNYFSAEDKFIKDLEDAQSRLNSLNTGITISSTMDEVKAAVEGAYNNPEVYANLLLAADALADYNNALESQSDLLSKNLQSGYNDLQTAVNSRIQSIRDEIQAENDLLNSRKATVQESISSINDILSVIDSGLMSLRNTSVTTQAGRIGSAQSNLESLLAVALSGGDVDRDVLERSIDTLSNINSKQFATAEDMLLEQAMASDKLRKLDVVMEDQLTIEEQMLKALQDEITSNLAYQEKQIGILEQELVFYQQQIDSLLGIDSSVKSVEAAINALQGMLSMPTMRAPSGGGSSGGSNVTLPSGGTPDYTSFVEGAYSQILGLSGNFSNKDERVGYWVDQLESGKVSTTGFGQVFATAAATTQGDIISDADFQYNKDVILHGSHADGLDTVPFDGYRAELHKGEMILTAPIAEMIRSMAGSGTGDLRDLMMELIRVIKNDSYNTNRKLTRLNDMYEILEQWNEDGQPPVRTTQP